MKRDKFTSEFLKLESTINGNTKVAQVKLAQMKVSILIEQFCQRKIIFVYAVIYAVKHAKKYTALHTLLSISPTLYAQIFRTNVF